MASKPPSNSDADSLDDPISRALARAQEQKASVRDWVRPESNRRDPDRPQGRNKSSGQEFGGKEVQLIAEELWSRHVLVDSAHDDPLISDRYKLLRTRIQQRMTPRGWTKLGITSPGSKEGKSLTSLNLAMTVARDTSSNVLLIDADLRRPSIAKYLGLSVSAGLAEYLRGTAEIDDVLLQPAGMPNLAIIPTTMSEQAALTQDSLNATRMHTLLDRFTDENTTVIVDLPPVLVADDVLMLAPLLDALLIVVRDGKTNLDDLQHSIELLKDFSLLGTVLNAAEPEPHGLYGYYYARSEGPPPAPPRSSDTQNTNASEREEMKGN